MSTLVTGGSGVVGRALLGHLVSDREVRALVRSDHAAATVTALGANPVRGDILDYGSLAQAMDGCDVVYHVAGSNEMCLADPSVLFRVNVDGSRNALRAAAAAGVRRMVFTSSATTLGEAQGSIGDERSAHRGSFLSNYERSKYEAERALLAEQTSVELVVVNPSSVQGPGRGTGTGKLFLDLINGKIPALVDSRFSMVDIDDCARGHILAESNGVPGERYVLSGFSLDRAGRATPRGTNRTSFPATHPARRFGQGSCGAVRAGFANGSTPPALLCRDGPCVVVWPLLRRISRLPRIGARIHAGPRHHPTNNRVVRAAGPGEARATRARALAPAPVLSIDNDHPAGRLNRRWGALR